MCVCAYVCVFSFFVMSDCFPSNKLELLLNLVPCLTPPHPPSRDLLWAAWLLECGIKQRLSSSFFLSGDGLAPPLHNPLPLPQFANQVAGGRRPGGKGCRQVLAPLVLVTLSGPVYIRWVILEIPLLWVSAWSSCSLGKDASFPDSSLLSSCFTLSSGYAASLLVSSSFR